MLDLDAIIDSTFQIKIEGLVIEVKEPSHSMYNKILNISQAEDTQEIYARQLEVAHELINNNVSGYKIGKEKLSKMPQRVIAKIVNYIFAETTKKINDPN